MTTTGYRCRRCGEWHDELPFTYHAAAPAYWSSERAADPGSVLGEEQCVIEPDQFFVRGLVPLPVTDDERDFEWGAWASLSQDSFERMSAVWEQPGRERERPVFGWLATELSVYVPSTSNLKTIVHTQPVGLRPLIELEPTEHPLAVDQREGVSLARVQKFAELLLH